MNLHSKASYAHLWPHIDPSILDLWIGVMEINFRSYLGNLYKARIISII